MGPGLPLKEWAHDLRREPIVSECGPHVQSKKKVKKKRMNKGRHGLTKRNISNYGAYNQE